MMVVTYVLCALTSLACAVLLFRAYRSSGTRLLLWSAVCFLGLAINNVLIVVDVSLLAETDLSSWRSLPALAGVVALIYAMIWETR